MYSVFGEISSSRTIGYSIHLFTTYTWGGENSTFDDCAIQTLFFGKAMLQVQNRSSDPVFLLGMRIEDYNAQINFISENIADICPTAKAYQVKHHRNTFVIFHKIDYKQRSNENKDTKANFSLGRQETQAYREAHLQSLKARFVQ